MLFEATPDVSLERKELVAVPIFLAQRCTRSSTYGLLRDHMTRRVSLDRQSLSHSDFAQSTKAVQIRAVHTLHGCRRTPRTCKPKSNEQIN